MMTYKGMEVPYPIISAEINRMILINGEYKKQNNNYYNIVLCIAAK